jgi:long-chain acyl-CoA synthetase
MADSEYLRRPWEALYDDDMRRPLEGVPASLLVLFDDAVAAAPDQFALAYFDGRLSYRELDRLVSGLAGHLRAHGFAAGDRLAVVLQNVPQFVITLLATWRAGGIVVPVNPMLRERELQYVVDDAGVRAVVSSRSAWHDGVADVAARAGIDLCLTADEHDLQTRGDARVLPPSEVFDTGAADVLAIASAASPLVGPARPAASDIALICYTSGTSGQPKGATNTHGNLSTGATLIARRGDLVGSTIFALAPLFHITGLVCEVATAIATQGTLAMAYRFEPGAVLDALIEHEPSYMVGPSTAYIALMAHPDATPEHFRSFRYLYAGGAPLPPAVVDEFRQRFGQYIRNGYGLTESTAGCITVPRTLEAPIDPDSGTLSIGIPVPGALVRILDDDGHEVPLGTLGEVAVRSPTVVPGYWQRGEETVAALPDGELLTGDVGFMDPAGWVYLVDRKKDMIVASGFKVWPREVEDVLYTHPAVREAAVVGVADPYRGETVRAFVSLKPGGAATPTEVIAFCKSQMAAYKYPRQVEILPELPKTASGKILRRELRDAAASSCADQTDRPVRRTRPAPDARRDDQPVARRLLEEATRLFATQGFDRTTVQQVVDATGVTKGAMYYYFGSKDDLLHAIYARVLADQSERLERFVVADGPVEDRLHAAAADVVVTSISNLDDTKIFFRSLHQLSPERQQQVRRERRRYHERFRTLIEEGQAAGRFRRDMPADLPMDYFFGGIHHLGQWYRRDGRLTPEQVGRHFADLLLASLVEPA